MTASGAGYRQGLVDLDTGQIARRKIILDQNVLMTKNLTFLTLAAITVVRRLLSSFLRKRG